MEEKGNTSGKKTNKTTKDETKKKTKPDKTIFDKMKDG